MAACGSQLAACGSEVGRGKEKFGLWSEDSRKTVAVLIEISNFGGVII